MTSLDTNALDEAIQTLPVRFPGPGGAVAVVKDGVAIIRHGWGYADLARRIPFTPRTLAPICSITKQFTCALLLDLVGDPAALDPAIAALVPRLEAPVPRTIDLANNQSGLRDYWALTVLCGASPDGAFRPADSDSLIGRTRSLHFAPGTRYSYSNGNFRMLASAMADRAGRPFDELLMERIVGPAGMATAVFCAETGACPGDATGYEGDPSFGFVPAVNRIHWSGDAGLCASLDDMIAWEQAIDRTRDDAGSLYRRLASPPVFADGNAARYGLGLAHMMVGGRAMTGHGGALRGWRLQRMTVPSERLSVVVLFNHAVDPQAAALHVLGAALGIRPDGGDDAQAGLFPKGRFLDAETGLLLTVEPAGDGHVRAGFATGAERLVVGTDGVARGGAMILQRSGEDLMISRPGDNVDSRAVRVRGDADPVILGEYRSDELDSRFVIVSAGGVVHGAFDGFLGQGAMQPLHPVADDLWTMPCQRAMDAPAPGDWTVRIERAGTGGVAGLSIGCWLARGVDFARTG